MDGYRYLLLLRFAVLNLIAFALLGALWLQGLVHIVFEANGELVTGICAVFAAGLLMAGREAARLAAQINDARENARERARELGIAAGDPVSRMIRAGQYRTKLAGRIAPVRHVANGLVFLGLIGTVLGMIIALSGVEPDAVADVDRIGPMVSTLISGISIALYTTLVGAVLNIWLMMNYRVLEYGAVKLMSLLVDAGERDQPSLRLVERDAAA